MSIAIKDLVNPKILTQPIYEPGKPIEEVARELGLDPAQIAKLASNENPLGPSPKALQAATEELKKVQLYPDGACFYLKQALENHWKLDSKQFVLGNGSNEVIELIGHAFLQAGDEVVMGKQAFIVYKLISLLFGATPIEVEMPDYKHDLDLMRNAITEKTKLVFVPSPNNPTGTANTEEELYKFVRSLPEHVIFCLDEAYAEYIDNAPNLLPLIQEGRKVIGLRTFSKIYGLAGLRIGYAYTQPEIAKVLNQVREPFNVNSIAQAAAIAAIQDSEHTALCKKQNRAGLDQLAAGLEKLKIPFVPSFANFILAEVGDATNIYQQLQKLGVITRPMAPYGLPKHLRISIGTQQQNEKALQALTHIIQPLVAN